MIPLMDSTDDPADVEDYYGWEVGSKPTLYRGTVAAPPFDHHVDIFVYSLPQVEAHQIAKPTIDRNKIPDLFDSRNTYFFYVAIKDEDRAAAKAKHKIFLEEQKKKEEALAKKRKMKAKGR